MSETTRPDRGWNKTDHEIRNYNRLGAHLARGESRWEARPFHVEFAPDERCNLRCPSCPQSEPGFRARSLDREVAGRILDEVLPLASLLTPSAGSEPLAGDWEFLVEKCREHGVLLNLITNGTLLTAERLERLGDRLARLQISIDSHRPEVFERLRTPAKFARVAENARRAAERGAAHGIPVWFTLVLSRHNVDELSEYVAWAAAQGASRVHVLELLPLTAAYEDYRVAFDERLRARLEAAVEVARAVGIDLSLELPGAFRALHRFRPPTLRMAGADVLRLFHDHLLGAHAGFCPQVATYLRIDAGGNVYPCCRSGEQLWMGNLLESSFEAIWNGERFRELRAEMFRDEPNPTCLACPVRTSYVPAGAR